jgi:hypothetical protein
MIRRISFCVAACWWLHGSAAVQAQVVVQTPWVNVEVRRPEVIIQAPFVTLRIARRTTVPVCPTPPVMPLPASDAPPVRGEPPPVPTPPPSASPVPAVPAAAPTLAQFASSFVPQPGIHEAVLLHPATGQPVKVRFLLPSGTLRHLRVHRYRLTFDYGRNDVALVFLRDGSVRVRN